MKPYPFSLDGLPHQTTKRSRWSRFVDRHLPRIVLYLMVATLLAVVLLPYIVVTVPSGYVGVLWKRFGNGTVLDPRQLRGEGLRFLLPWNQLFLYDLRLQSITETYNAISGDGVSLSATMNVRFRLQRNAIPVLHQAVGPEYLNLLVKPGIGSLTREVMAEYTAEQVYSTARQEIQDKIRGLVESRLSQKMMEHEGEEESYRISLNDTVILFDTLVQGIELPQVVVGAIMGLTPASMGKAIEPPPPTTFGPIEHEWPYARCETCSAETRFGYRNSDGTMRWFCAAHRLAQNWSDARTGSEL